MSDNSLGVAVLDLTARLDSLEDQLEKARKTSEGKASEIAKVFSAIATSAVLAAVVKAYQQVVKAGEETLVTEAKVAGVLRATGNAAGYTVGQLSQMSNEFSRLTGVDDEVILNAEAILATFRQVGREVFPEATQAALDMSAVMGQDLQSSITMIGKALNDPIAGLTALKKVGVTFNDEQERTIKNLVASNDLMGAQQVIMKELQSEFGGTAQRMEEAGSGSKRLGNSWDNLQAELGRGLIPQQRVWNLLLADTLDLITENVSGQIDYADAQRLAIGEMNRSGEALILNRMQFNENRDAIEQNTRQIMRWTEIGLAWEERLMAEANSAQLLSGALENVDYKGLLDLTMSLSTETAKFNEQQDAVRQKQAEIQAEINLLLTQGYSPLSEKVIGLQTDYANLGLKYDENALKHQAATNKILYDLFLQKLSTDGLTDAEYQMALQAGLALGQVDQASIDLAKNFDAVTAAVEGGRLKVEDMKAALDLLPTYKNIDVVIDVLTRGFASYGYGSSYATNDLKYQNQANHAAGTDGWLTVPSGYPNDSYSVGLTSGETYAVLPRMSAGQMSAPSIANANMTMNGDGTTMPPIQFIYQPFIGVNDEYEAKNKLRSIINDLNRESSRK